MRNQRPLALLSLLALLTVAAATHYSLLRSIEAAFGLPFLGHAGDPATATTPGVADPSPNAGWIMPPVAGPDVRPRPARRAASAALRRL